MTWKSLSPPRGLQLYPSCQAQCPVKTSNEMDFLPCSICSPTFNDALTSRTFLLLLIVYSIQRKNQQKYTICASSQLEYICRKSIILTFSQNQNSSQSLYVVHGTLYPYNFAIQNLFYFLITQLQHKQFTIVATLLIFKFDSAKILFIFWAN